MDIVSWLDKALILALIFLRIATALAVMPFYGYRGVALPVKAGLSAFLAFLLLPSVPAPVGWTVTGLNLWHFMALALPEIVAGLLLGMVCGFLFYGVELSGQVIGMQMGFGIVGVIDPMTEEQVSIISQLQYLFATLVFLTFNGHHFLLEGLGQSFQAVPLGGAHFPAGLSQTVTTMSGDIFVAAVKIAAPVMAALFLTDVALGIIARTVPQMNIFIVGFPLKIGVGLLGLAFTWPMFTYVLKLLWKVFQNDWLRFIALMGR